MDKNAENPSDYKRLKRIRSVTLVVGRKDGLKDESKDAICNTGNGQEMAREKS